MNLSYVHRILQGDASQPTGLHSFLVSCCSWAGCQQEHLHPCTILDAALEAIMWSLLRSSEVHDVSGAYFILREASVRHGGVTSELFCNRGNKIEEYLCIRTDLQPRPYQQFSSLAGSCGVK
ncbi:hypothetical protein EYF80_047767 [Liparis tanakae]|uniref:Uncharacterized protein n=1 Tax=Liparis tanakae TaxID=230148 RepID=A0A4Z2FMH3_9TELE|nr:hypothetical protein EYF80_047767 [Liparis tanakae]